jgi:hypothetical protein
MFSVIILESLSEGVKHRTYGPGGRFFNVFTLAMRTTPMSLIQQEHYAHPYAFFDGAPKIFIVRGV